jgi:hypothetical protein
MTLSREIEAQVETYMQKRDVQFEASQTLLIRDTVEALVVKREAPLLAEQKLAIREELESHISKKREQQRGTVQFIIGLVGLSAFALTAFIWSEIKVTAK